MGCPIRRDGHEALLYTPRFSPNGQAIATFGSQGSHPQPIAGTQPLRAVLAAEKVAVESIPPVSGLRIVPPPPPPTKR
jgi:hypothetical protein